MIRLWRIRRFLLLSILLFTTNVAFAQVNQTGADLIDTGGESGLRLRLLYQIPFVETDVRLDANEQFLGTSFSIEDDLDADTQFFLPTFEVDFNSGGFGRYVLEYSEFRLKGADFLQRPIFFDGSNFPANAPIRSKYEFRTLAATAIFGIPIDNWIDINIIASARYLNFYTSLTAPRNFVAADDTVEAVIPTIGVGADLLIFEGLHVFGSVQAISFSLDGSSSGELLLLGDDRSKVSSREIRAGVSYDFTPWLTGRLEYRSFRISLRKDKAKIRQEYDGVVFGVEVKFF